MSNSIIRSRHAGQLFALALVCHASKDAEPEPYSVFFSKSLNVCVATESSAFNEHIGDESCLAQATRETQRQNNGTVPIAVAKTSSTQNSV